jgi:hypothetical protein
VDVGHGEQFTVNCAVKTTPTLERKAPFSRVKPNTFTKNQSQNIKVFNMSDLRQPRNPQIQTFMSLAMTIRNLEQPCVVAVDGRAGSGKTTFATKLARVLEAPLIHTDDIAWHHSFFNWWQLATHHVLQPFKDGKSVEWTPEAYKTRGRQDVIRVPQAPVLVFEGVSASRLELAHLLGFCIWVETDAELCLQRMLIRDGQDSLDFQLEWDAEERPFLANDKPWTRANMVVDGAPSIGYDSEKEFVSYGGVF